MKWDQDNNPDLVWTNLGVLAQKRAYPMAQITKIQASAKILCYLMPGDCPCSLDLLLISYRLGDGRSSSPSARYIRY